MNFLKGIFKSSNKSKEEADTKNKQNNSLSKKIGFSASLKIKIQLFQEEYYDKETTYCLPLQYDDIKANIDIDNLLVYSFSNPHPFSFLKGAKVLIKNSPFAKFPSPVYDENYFLQNVSIRCEDFLKDYELDSSKGLVLVNSEISKKFAGIVSKSIKGFIYAVLTSSSFSLPVVIFEPKSTLHRLADYWSYFPNLLFKAYTQTDPLERLKLTISFAFAGLHISAKQLKPFNPLMGETFQAILSEGSSIYMEHIQHKPTVIRVLIRHAKGLFELNGYIELSARNDNLTGSKIIIEQKGPLNVIFNYPEGKECISYNMPILKMLSCHSEKDRSMHWTEDMIFRDVRNRLKGIIKFGANKKDIFEVSGAIVSYKYPKDYRFDYKAESSELANDLEYFSVESIVKGDWLNSLYFDKVEYWDNQLLQSFDIIPKKNVLPSDGRFREDLMWLIRAFQSLNEKERKSYEALSQGWKDILEDVQRKDRELKLQAKKLSKK